jgi:glycerol kinase
MVETTALGAAMLAGLGAGFWSDREELRATWQEERRFLPQMPADRRDMLIEDWRRAVAKA